jgi:hypothetical protein
MQARFDSAATAGKTEVLCPYCGSNDTEIFSLFGQQLLTMQFYCSACRTPFEYVKDDELLNADAGAHVSPSF